MNVPFEDLLHQCVGEGWDAVDCDEKALCFPEQPLYELGAG